MPTFIPIPGATSAQYTVSSALSADAGQYYVVVSNACGVVQSEAVVVTVAPLDPCRSLDFEIDWEPSGHDPASTVSFAIDLDNPDLNGTTELVFTGQTYSPPSLYENPWILKFNTTVTSILFSCCTTFTTGILIRSMSALREVRFESLTNQNGADWNWYDPVDGGDPALSVWQSISIKDNPSLSTVSMPYLANSGGLNISNNTSLQSIDFPNLSPLGKTFNFSGNALTEQSVNQILAIFAASSWQGFLWAPAVLHLSGGANATPTGQGLVDKATIASRPYVTVTTN